MRRIQSYSVGKRGKESSRELANRVTIRTPHLSNFQNEQTKSTYSAMSHIKSFFICIVLCLCVHMCSMRKTLGVLLYHSLLYPLRQGLSLDLELGWQPASPLIPTVPPDWGYRDMVTSSFFLVSWGTWTQVLMLAQQVLFQCTISITAPSYA